MRTLSEGFTTAQKASHVDAAVQLKIVSASNGSTYTFTRSRILEIDHLERPYDMRAEVLLDNSDKALDTVYYVALQGSSAEISWGVGANLSACAPLKVISHTWSSSPGRLQYQIQLMGDVNIMDLEEASEDYQEPTDSTATIKGLIIDIAMGEEVGYKFVCFNSYPGYVVDWDSEDDVIDTFIPADSFRIVQGESRLKKIKELLELTSCVMRFEDDGHIHIFVPTRVGPGWTASRTYFVGQCISPTNPNNDFAYQCIQAGVGGIVEPTWGTAAGATVWDGLAALLTIAPDYEYNDIPLASNHTFFGKSRAKSLVSPNYVVISSPDGAYSGTATATDNSRVNIRHYEKVSVGSNAEATAVAEAQLAQHELHAEMGGMIVPMNCGQEVLDFVKLTDRRQGDEKLANVAYIHRKFNSRATDPKDKWGMEIALGDVELVGKPGAKRSLTRVTEATDYQIYEQPNKDSARPPPKETAASRSVEDANLLAVRALFEVTSELEWAKKYHNRLLNDPIAINVVLYTVDTIPTYLKVPFACTVLGWEIIAETPGAIVIDVWQDSYTNAPLTNDDAMPGAGKEPTIAATNQKAQDLDVTDWTKNTIDADSWLAFNIDSFTTITKVTLTLWVRRI